MTTVRKIARLAGVSVSTVSLVLNNKPGVSEQMKQLIHDAIRQLDVSDGQPQVMPSLPLTEKLVDNQLVTRGNGLQSPSIVVLHPPVLSSSYVFSEVLQGIQAAAQSHNVQLRLVANAPEAADDHVANLYFSDPNLYPDGLLIFGARHEEPLIDVAQGLGIPCVVLGRAADQYNVSGVGRDEEYYAHEATRYLIDLGHRAIAFVGGDPAYDFVSNRLNGYRRALEEIDIDIPDHWIKLGNGAAATHTILDDAPEVTAVLFVNDTHAAGGLPVIEAKGLSIPDDLSVISFDDTDIARNATPPLTSISYRFYQEGQWAVKMLVDQIRFPFVEKVYTFFKAELIERESCAPPAS